ncbi:hypothetical protein [Rhizobium sp. 2MFCol3.1]|uniref:hypothetical protein n=1 Tax=Rhizobium sp. 2MFCol3.1 TaxID=1246459 RepID=UPI001FD975EE|nr:hypothetical protein [Rhizobium sp. 2MFCol3.1]
MTPALPVSGFAQASGFDPADALPTASAMTVRSSAGALADVGLVAEVVSNGSWEAQPVASTPSSAEIKIKSFGKLLLQ